MLYSLHSLGAAENIIKKLVFEGVCGNSKMDELLRGMIKD
jgi:hypothetical protein